MIWILTNFWRGLFSNGARTDEAAADPLLRGRTYGIPFDRVWNAALVLARGRLPRWTLLDADDYEGVINAEVAEAMLRPATRITIQIGLGVDAQTRVDAVASAPDRRADLGASARALAEFFSELDRAVSEPLIAQPSMSER